MTNTATAQKSTKGSDLRPPKEIVENTKARRAWLAEQLAIVLAQPDTCPIKTKIVGTGSYQVVSVWKLVTVEGRERFRGVCQLCGHLQVVENDRIVLHGYNRPGHGYIVGECPAAKQQPLNTSDALTRKYLAQFAGELPEAIAIQEAAEKAVQDAQAAQRAAGEYGDYSKPYRPSGRNATPVRIAQFEGELSDWARRHPLTAALSRATAQWREAHNRRVWLSDMVTHLEGLLAAGILGSPLTREVVA